MYKALVQSVASKVNELIKIKYKRDKVTKIPRYKPRCGGQGQWSTPVMLATWRLEPGGQSVRAWPE